MSAKSVRKGKAGEREVIAILAETIPGLVRTLVQARNGAEAPDIDAPGCPIQIEVKLHKRPNASAAFRKAIEDADDRADARPIVVFTRGNREQWCVTVSADFFREMFRAWSHVESEYTSGVRTKSPCADCD